MIIDGLEFDFLMTQVAKHQPKCTSISGPESAVYRRERHAYPAQLLHSARRETRDTSKWTEYLNETLDMWGNDAEVLFMPHTWPVWAISISMIILVNIAILSSTFTTRPCTWQTRATP